MMLQNAMQKWPNLSHTITWCHRWILKANNSRQNMKPCTNGHVSTHFPHDLSAPILKLGFGDHTFSKLLLARSRKNIIAWWINHENKGENLDGIQNQQTWKDGASEGTPLH
jgi:hypothetical protein